MEQKSEAEPSEGQKAFDAFTGKMNEYQDLLALCDRVSNTEENRNFKEACKRRLEALKRELIDLAARLQDNQ